MPGAVSDRLLSQAVNASNSLIVIADAREDDTGLVFVNDYFLDFTGYTPEEVLGKNCRFLQYRPDGTRVEQEGARRAIREALESGEQVRAILHNFKKNGDEFFNELFISPVRDERGEITHFIGVQNDITERYRQQQNLSGLFESAVSLMGIVERREGRWVHVAMNPKAREFFADDEFEPSEHSIEESGFPSAMARDWEAAFDHAAEEGFYRFHSLAGRAGDSLHLHVNVSRVGHETADVSGRSTRCCYVAEDLSALRVSEGGRLLLESAVAHSQEPLLVVRRDGDSELRVIFANDAFCAFTGYSHDDLQGRSISSLESQGATRPIGDAILALAKSYPNEGRSLLVASDGSELRTSWSATPVAPAGDEGEMFWVVSFHDRTPHYELEQQVINIQAQEQQRFAHDLHDGLLQELAALRLQCHALRYREGEEQQAAVDQIIGMADEISTSAREIVHGFLPANLEEHGFLSALEMLTQRTADIHEVVCTLHADSVPKLFESSSLGDSGQVATHLIRIAQEAINNAVRHSGATRIRVELEPDGDHYELRVRDDGTGFDAGKAPDSGSMGMQIMTYRVDCIHADLTIDSTPGEGTTVTCRFLPPNDGGAKSDCGSENQESEAAE